MKIRDIHINVVGVTFKNENGTSRQKILETVNNDDKLILQREPNNIYDIHAIMVLTQDGQQIGYIGKQYAEILAPMMDGGRIFTAEVDDTGTHKPKNAKRPIRYCSIIINEE